MSVVIPVRNEQDYIHKCIVSLVEQDYPKNLYEVLVVDGMSTDNSRRIVQSSTSNNPNIHVHENPNLLTSFGLNIGIKKSKGAIIIILGAHSFVETDFIRKNEEILTRIGADCVGGPIISIGETFRAKGISLAMSSIFGVGDALFRYAEKEGYVDTVAFGGYRREVFEKIGLFDEELTRNQDDEFNYRLRKAGGKIFITPQIKSYYYSSSNLAKLWKQYFQYGVWKIRVLQKHPRMMRLRQFVPGVFVLRVIMALEYCSLQLVFLYLLTFILAKLHDL